ncbi:hypothetical protein Tco_0211153 [Tanacetum coccineum]
MLALMMESLWKSHDRLPVLNWEEYDPDDHPLDNGDTLLWARNSVDSVFLPTQNEARISDQIAMVAENKRMAAPKE